MSSHHRENFPNYFTMYEKGHPKKRNIFATSPAINTFDEQAIKITHQLCIVLDITGSMQSSIDSVKEQIIPLIDTLRQEASAAVDALFTSTLTDDKASKEEEPPVRYALDFQVAIVGYRDFGDANHFEVHDFTDNIKAIKEFVARLQANGGDDDPEDILGAFIHVNYGIDEQSRKLSWQDAEDTASKAIYLITDAPAHGKLFNDQGVVGDKFYSVDTTEEWKFLLTQMKKENISFTIIKINDRIEMTCEAFQRLCNPIEITFKVLDISQRIQQGRGYTHVEREVEVDEIREYEASPKLKSSSRLSARTSYARHHARKDLAHHDMDTSAFASPMVRAEIITSCNVASATYAKNRHASAVNTAETRNREKETDAKRSVDTSNVEKNDFSPYVDVTPMTSEVKEVRGVITREEKK